MNFDDKLNAIQGRRETLLHEQFGAQLDVQIAKAGRDPNLRTEPEARLAEVEAKLETLDKAEAEVKADQAKAPAPAAKTETPED